MLNTAVQVNERYIPQLQQVLTWPQSIGIVGGRPASSLYFVGCQDDHVIYLDPHQAQQVISNAPPMRLWDLPLKLKSISCIVYPELALFSLEPSLCSAITQFDNASCSLCPSDKHREGESRTVLASKSHYLSYQPMALTKQCYV